MKRMNKGHTRDFIPSDIDDEEMLQGSIIISLAKEGYVFGGLSV